MAYEKLIRMVVPQTTIRTKKTRGKIVRPPNAKQRSVGYPSFPGFCTLTTIFRLWENEKHPLHHLFGGREGGKVRGQLGKSNELPLSDLYET